MIFQLFCHKKSRKLVAQRGTVAMRAPAACFLGLWNQFIGWIWKILNRWARKIAKSHEQNLIGCYCRSVEDQKAERHENVGAKVMGFQRGTREVFSLLTILLLYIFHHGPEVMEGLEGRLITFHWQSSGISSNQEAKPGYKTSRSTHTLWATVSSKSSTQCRFYNIPKHSHQLSSKYSDTWAQVGLFLIQTTFYLQHP